jgi:DNA-binding NarL/FixJ family response regulator
MCEKKIKVMLVDDQKLMIEGLDTIISNKPEFEIVAKAENGKEAIKILESVKPDLILMDIRMPIMDGVEATKIIVEKYPKIIVLILTTFDDDEYIIEALSIGAAGYLLKDIDSDKLIDSIKEALSGNLLLTGKIAQKLALNLKKSTMISTINVNIDINLTKREEEISKLLLEGFNTREIADKLFLSQGTIKNYLTNIYSKIGTNDRGKALTILKRLYDVN